MKTNLIKIALAMLTVLSVAEINAEELQPRATTTWLFNQFYEGANVASITTADDAKGMLYVYDKLYFCIGDGSAGRTRSIAATSVTTMPNAIAPKAEEVTPFGKGDYVGIKFNAASRASQNVTVDNTSQYMLAGVKPIVAGKLYVLINSKSSGKTVTLYEGNTVKATASRTTSDWMLLSCEVTANKRYFFGCEEADWVLYGVKFVPTEDKTDLSQHDVSVSIKNGYATFSSACNYKLPTGYKAYVASAIAASSVTLKQINHIPANTGVVLIGDTPTDETITMKNIRESDITDADKTVAATNFLVANIGAYALPANVGSNYNYILVADGESAVFKHTTGTGDLAANKAFLRTTTNVTAEGARGFSFDFGGGETTAVTEVELAGDNNSGKCYTLQGKEVRTPSKGLYIVNGKKVIIK